MGTTADLWRLALPSYQGLSAGHHPRQQVLSHLTSLCGKWVASPTLVLFCFSVLGINLTALHTLSKSPTSESQPLALN